MGRVNIRTNQRESMKLKIGHKAYIEKQPGVSNWNLYDSRPRRNHTVISEADKSVMSGY